MNRLSNESGIGIPEVIIAATLGLAVAAALATTLFAVFRTDSYTASDSDTLAELRRSNRRLVTELRQAAKVYAESACFGATRPAEVPTDQWKRRLRFWIDSDRDGLQDSAERIEWRLSPTEGGKAELRRRTAPFDTDGVVLARDLLDGEVFECNAAPPDTELIKVSFTADADSDRYAIARRVRTEVTLRNVPD